MTRITLHRDDNMRFEIVDWDYDGDLPISHITKTEQLDVLEAYYVMQGQFSAHCLFTLEKFRQGCPFIVTPHQLSWMEMADLNPVIGLYFHYGDDHG